MSNQYYNALHYAAQDLADDLKKYGIEVRAEERMIIWRETAIPVKFGTTRSECLKMLRKLIAVEKRDEVARAAEKQGRLL